MTVHVHRLPLTEFDKLAGGDGHFDSHLRAGQRSKRLLQIMVTLNEAAARFPDTFAAGRFAESYATLVAITRRAPGAVDSLLFHPQVGAWAAHALRCLVGADVDEASLDDDLGHFGAITAAAALVAGESFELTLRVRADGTLMVPTFGLARLGVPPAWCRARARSGEHGFELDVNGGTLTVPVRAQAGSPTWWPLRRLTSTVDGCRIDVAVDDIDPYRDCRGIGARDRLPAAELTSWRGTLDEAWALLCRGQRSRARSLAAGVTALIPLSPVPATADLSRATGLSATTNDACGAVALSRPLDGVTLAATLVHEFQHSKLAALLDLVPLFDADAHAVFYAPWRVDPRPLHGLLHGTYAYLALVDFWQAYRLSTDGAEGRVAHFEFARWRRAVGRTLRALHGSRQLTAAGERFVDGMDTRLAAWRSLPVPAEPERLARDARIDHWTSWRLRNLRPDQDEVARWADAWLTGSAQPATWPRVSIIEGDQQSGTDARLELAYLRLRDPHRFDGLRGHLARLQDELPDVTPADVLYAQADYQGAVRLYIAAVAAAPDRVDSWAGLVLANRRLRTLAAGVLAASPETVLALHRQVQATTGTPPDIEALSCWLAGADDPPHNCYQAGD